MDLLVLSLAVMVIGGLGALLAWGPRWPTRIGVLATVGGCAIALVPAIRVLAGAESFALRLPWQVPFGSFSLEVDALSAFFLLPILGLSALAAIFGGGYLASFSGRRRLGPSWFFYSLLVASMVLVVVARNGILFLTAWETMTIASFFLVSFEDEKEDVRRAGWTYLVAAHLGTAFLLVLFLLLGRGGGSLDFDRIAAAPMPPGLSGIVFVLAMAGFGTKAGFIPLHVWLPEAHPAAPSHVSALMSGVMIKTGIYGLLRTLTFLGPPPAWWGWVLVAVGASSGILGVLFALAQHDLKRLLAYHSVENIGIIALGLGVGILGLSAGVPALAVLGFAGGLLHVLNHAIFKGLLFFGAGAVLHATGTRNIERLGGLLKRMPWTGATFLIGAAAISGLPPLNGFTSEFLIYLGAFKGITGLDPGRLVAMLVVIAGLALIGGLAAACFAKAFGMVFLGEPRSDAAAGAHEAGFAMRLPMVVLAAACILVGLLAPFLLRFLHPVLCTVTASGLAPAAVLEYLTAASGSLFVFLAAVSVFLALLALILVLRAWLLLGRDVREGVTWDCGFARPAARMQYTASSFAQPLVDLFRAFLWTRRTCVRPQGYFPGEASLRTETPDLFREGLFAPLFLKIERILGSLRWLQHGRVQLYVLYIAVVILVLLVWKLW